MGACASTPSPSRVSVSTLTKISDLNRLPSIATSPPANLFTIVANPPTPAVETLPLSNSTANLLQSNQPQSRVGSLRMSHTGLAEEDIGKSLASVLHDSVCIEFFSTHLATEHSSENLDFYEAVDHFHYEFDSHTPTPTQSLALKIYSLYVTNDAPLAVNIPAKLRNEIERCMSSGEDVERGLFDDAMKEIYNVMNRDSFARFKMSDLWKTYKENPMKQQGSKGYIYAKHENVFRLGDCYTGRFKGPGLMEFVEVVELSEVLMSQEGRSVFEKFIVIDGKADLFELYSDIDSYRNLVVKMGRLPGQEDIEELEKLSGGLLNRHFKNLEATSEASFKKFNSSLSLEYGRVTKVLEKRYSPIKLSMLFDEMFTLVYDAMVEDTYKRFLNCALYVKFRMGVKKAEEIEAGKSRSRSASLAQQ